MTSSDNPPRMLGSLLALLGLALTLGGGGLVQQGDSAYFLVAGLGIVVSGVLIALGKLAGVWIYLGVLALMIVWSVAEAGADLGAVLPRVLLPSLIGAYLFSSRVRPRLS